MSGIACTYNIDGRPLRRDEIGRMVQAMAHRGPDGHRVWHEGSAGLGHCMLHVSPESVKEAPPLSDEQKTVILTADVRLDNREELMRLLDVEDRYSQIGDSHLILRAYERWGEACPEHLLGAFAFAIWDATDQKVFCARDHIGVKPLYYVYHPGRLFACASEMKALLSLSEVSDRINEVTLGCRLVLIQPAPEDTIFQDISSLPSGHTLTVSKRGGLSTSKYWSLQSVDAVHTEATDEVYAEAFRELFSEAVRCRVRSPFPVAAELSGGLDSSSVTCVAQKLRDDSVHTVSLKFDSFPQCDETSFIESVLQRGGFIPHFASGEALTRMSHLDDIFRYIDDGTAAVGNHYMVWQRASMAREAGARILLTGYDGDSVVSHGFEYFRELAEDGRWEAFAQEARANVTHLQGQEHVHANDQLMVSTPGWLRAYGYPHLERLVEGGQYLRFMKDVRAISKHFPVSQTELYRRYWRRLLMPDSVRRRWLDHKESWERAVPDLIDDDFAARIQLSERIRSVESEKRQAGTVRDAQWRHLTSGRLQRSLESLNHYAAAHGIELRHPFMDKRLLEYCLSLPSEQSFSGGWSRVLLRRAMEDIVPDVVRWRAGKTGFLIASATGFFEQDADRLGDVVSDLGPLEPYVDVRYVRSMVEKGLMQSPVEVSRLNVLVALSYKLRQDAQRLPSTSARNQERPALS